MSYYYNTLQVFQNPQISQPRQHLRSAFFDLCPIEPKTTNHNQSITAIMFRNAHARLVVASSLSAVAGAGVVSSSCVAGPLAAAVLRHGSARSPRWSAPDAGGVPRQNGSATRRAGAGTRGASGRRGQRRRRRRQSGYVARRCGAAGAGAGERRRADSADSALRQR